MPKWLANDIFTQTSEIDQEVDVAYCKTRPAWFQKDWFGWERINHQA